MRWRSGWRRWRRRPPLFAKCRPRSRRKWVLFKVPFSFIFIVIIIIIFNENNVFLFGGVLGLLLIEILDIFVALVGYIGIYVGFLTTVVDFYSAFYAKTGIICMILVLYAFVFGFICLEEVSYEWFAMRTLEIFDMNSVPLPPATRLCQCMILVFYAFVFLFRRVIYEWFSGLRVFRASRKLK